MSKSAPVSTIGDMPDLDAFVQQGQEPRPAVPQPPATVAPTVSTRQTEATIVMTTRTPVSLHQRLKVHCAVTQQSLQEFAIRAIENQLAAEQSPNS
jgi:hypothetical protein